MGKRPAVVQARVLGPRRLAQPHAPPSALFPLSCASYLFFPSSPSFPSSSSCASPPHPPPPCAPPRQCHDRRQRSPSSAASPSSAQPPDLPQGRLPSLPA